MLLLVAMHAYLASDRPSLVTRDGAPGPTTWPTCRVELTGRSLKAGLLGQALADMRHYNRVLVEYPIVFRGSGLFALSLD